MPEDGELVVVVVERGGPQPYGTGIEQAMVVRIGIGSDRPVNAPAINEQGVPRALVVTNSLVAPPA